MNDSAEARSRVLHKVVKLVLDRHFNLAGVDHQAWARKMLEQEPEIVAANADGFEAAVQETLAELGTSHTVFYQDRPTQFPPQHTINATLSLVETNGGQHWMFVDVFENGPACKAGIRPGDVLVECDGVESVPSAIPTFGVGQSYNIVVLRAGKSDEVTIDVPYRKGSKERPPIIEPLSVTYRTVAPGVGLLKVMYFPGALGIRFGQTLAKSIAALQEENCDRLVFDLRGNIGGSLGFGSLVSYLCPGHEAIGYSVTPKRLREGFSVSELPRVAMPRDRIEALLALGRFAVRDKSLMLLTQGLGPKPFHGRTVLLVNEWTASAGEMAAAFAAETQLALVVGRRTKGTVLGAMNFKVGEGYWLRLPVFGWFTAKQRCVEGEGVTPNITIPLGSPDSVRRDEELSQAVETVLQL